MAKMSLRPLFFLLTMAIALALAPWSSHGLNQSLSQLSTTSTTGPSYHGGTLLTGRRSINIYLMWYGSFSQKERKPITDFFSSFNPSKGFVEPAAATVSAWWRTTSSYKDKTKNSISSTVILAKQLADIGYSLGKKVKRGQIGNYVKSKIDSKTLPLDSNGIYFVLTAKDVTVNRFCMGSCGFHDSVMVAAKRRIVYAHVGDSMTQCPGLCAWPYAVPAYGPPGKALVAPNGVGADGLVMNIATILAGAATNPFKNGYFQGDALAPLEAVTACPGIFGAGAYPGYPGNLKVDKTTKASYNSYGANGRKFLLPAIWDPIHLNCMVTTA